MEGGEATVFCIYFNQLHFFCQKFVELNVLQQIDLANKKEKILVHQGDGYGLPENYKFHVTVFQIRDVIDIDLQGFYLLAIEF